jgi:two-component system, sensor histidine kinase YesM
MPRLYGRRYFYRVLGLFLAASLVPVLALSFALTGIASAALQRSAEDRGRAAAQAFSEGFRALTEGVDRSLALISTAPETAAALASPSGRVSDEASAALGRLLAREASREESLAFALVSSSGKFAYGTRAMPLDWDPAVYGSWGIFRKARESEGTAYEARRRVVENGETALIAAARALRDGSGEIKGYALAELGRSALARVARSGDFGLTADFELLSPSRLVAFSLSDPDREGFFEDELAPRVAGTEAGNEKNRASGVYEATSAAAFMARAILPSSLIEDFGVAMRRATIVGLAACAILALGLAIAASRIVTGPVLSISGAMRRLREGDLSARLVPASDDELGDMIRSFNDTAEKLGQLMRETIEDQELLRGAELRSLSARMNPHFLYNSLNSIRSLAKLGSDEEIVAMVASLGKLLRASADNRAELSTIGEGLELVRHYLAVEKIRFGERFSFDFEVEEGLADCELPSLVLEPLAENALTHGLERKTGKGRLTIVGVIERRVADGSGDASDAVIAFEDDGPGAPAEAIASLGALLESGELPTAGAGGNPGLGLGLAATNRRLRLRYGPGYGIRVSAGRGGRGFKAELRIPFRRSRECVQS